MRRLFKIIAVLAVLGLLAAIATYLMYQRVLAQRDKRIADIDSEVKRIRAIEKLDPAQACTITELHLLTRPVSRALTVDCSQAKIEATGNNVLKLSGLLRAQSVENALLGGGFSTKFCLAQTRDGWAVLGDAFHLDDCKFDADEDMSADELLAKLKGSVSEKRKSVALEAIDAVRRALDSEAPVPLVCAGLEPTRGKQLGMVDTDIFTLGTSDDSHQGIWRTFTSGAFISCAKGEKPTKYSLGCGLEKPWRYVLAFDQSEKNPPVETGVREFKGGTYRTKLRLIEVSTAKVLCAREVLVNLEETVLLGKYENIRDEYDQKIVQAVCREVKVLSQGRIEMDAFFRCD